MRIDEIIKLLEDIKEVEGWVEIDLRTLGAELIDLYYPYDVNVLKQCILNSVY